MRGNWKRYTLIVTMLVLICAAAALNWQSVQNVVPGGAATSETAGGKVLGEAALVSGGDGSVSGSATDEVGASGSAMDESGVYNGSEYFASARLTRQQARDNAVALLKDAAAEEGAAQSTLNGASEGIQAMAQYTMAEAQIENLVTAKGYTDCVAFMGADSLSVVVSTASGELSGDDVAKITDIAMTETSFPAANIKIMAAE